MEDNDVICLSSDDEDAQHEFSRKKLKACNILMTPKMEPKEKGRDTILCSLKRKNAENTNKSDGKLIKRAKIKNSHIEEITIGSPPKATGEDSRFNRTLGERSNKLRVELRNNVTENGTISINKLTMKKTLEMSKSTNQPKSSHSRDTTTRNNSEKLQLTNNNSNKSNSKSADTLKSRDLQSDSSKSDSRIAGNSRYCDLKSNSNKSNDKIADASRSRSSNSNSNKSYVGIADTSRSRHFKNAYENSAGGVVSPPKFINRDNSGIPRVTMSKIVYKFLENKLSNDAESAYGTTTTATSQVEIPKDTSSTIVAAINANRSRQKSHDEILSRSAMSLKNVDIAKNSKVHNLKSASVNTASRVVNPAAKFNVGENSGNPRVTMSKIVYKYLEKKLSDDAESDHDATPTAESQIEIPKDASAAITADKNANETSRKSQDKKPARYAMSLKIVDIFKNSKAGSVAITPEGLPDREKTTPKKSCDSRLIREPSQSPEMLLLPTIDTPKISKTTTDKSPVEAHSSNSSNSAMKSEGKIMRNIEKSTNGTPKSIEKSQLPSVTNCQILNDDSRKDIVNKNTHLIDEIEQPKASSSISSTRDSETTKPSSKSESRGSKITTEGSKVVIKRITPQQLSASQSRSINSKPDVQKKSKYLQNSTSYDPKETGAEILNGIDTSMLNDSKNLRAKESKSKDFVAMPGCSKTPDEKINKSPSALSPLKRKSTSSEILKKVEKRSKDASKSVPFEPQPGCSKSPDEIYEKPRLIVIDKKPILHEAEHDTFSRFLSLCLQTDRCPDMEKVVSKLKRYYEKLNPAYAASQAFRDTLNEKRELIMQKGQRVVYHYVQLLKNDMKANERIEGPVVKTRDDEGAADEVNEIEHEDEDEEDIEEVQRQRQKMKKIEKAMNECQKMIKKYENAEVDFENENNSQYIKLDRFKERMVQLYIQMCKYTHEHPDAGRAYLRPKHLRVTQIPSIDQAINNFINSKLSSNKKKLTKGKSFVDGLIFPDHVDILECVEKVNMEQELKLNKRAMRHLAQKAFTQLGKHLQEARQNDYWDTFSLNLDNNVDPATSDPELLEKLSANRIIAEENEKKVFEEFVRRQEEGKMGDMDDSPSKGEDEEDEEEEAEGNDKNTNGNDNSDVDMSIDEDSDRESEKEEEDDEAMSEGSQDKDEECTVVDDAKHISKNKNLEASEPTTDTRVLSPPPSPKNSAEEEVKTEVILAAVDIEDGENVPVQQERAQQPLRIRSFAKPPESWQCSQEFKEETNEDNETKPETLENTEEKISMVSYLPEQEKLNLTSKLNVAVVSNTDTKNITPIAPTKSLLSTTQTVNLVSSTTNSTNAQSSRYLTIAPGVMRPVQLPFSRVPNNVKTTKLVSVPRHQVRVTIPVNFEHGRTTQIRLRMPFATSTPIQRPQLQPKDVVYTQQIKPRPPLQQTSQVQVLRLSNGRCVATTMAPRLPNTQQFVTVATTSTPIRSPHLQPAPLNSTQLIRGGISGNKVLMPVTLTTRQCSQMQVLRLSNGKFITLPTSSSENSRSPREQQVERNSPQQQQKLLTGGASSVVVPVNMANIVRQQTLPVLKLRMNDNVQTVQQQRSIVTRVTQPSDHDRRTSESGLKRKNELF